MASKCRKFVPNIFNKTKCQTCFGSKEQHSAEALENNKASRKVSKCGYLFVAPGYDFSSPLDKSKRWQRRFFVLYDDGELAYSVDESPDTVPQSVVDMNKCTDVKDASGSTSHTNSLAVITPEKTTYIKGNSKEEIQWWYSCLAVFPENSSIVPKPRFSLGNSNTESSSDDESTDDDSIDDDDIAFGDISPSSMSPPESTESKSRSEVDKIKSKEQSFSTYRGVRSMKHKGDKHKEGLRKSSSLHDLSSEEKENSNLESSRFLSRSGDRLNSTDGSDIYTDSARLLAGYNHPYVTQPLTSWKTPAMAKQQKSSSQQQDMSSSNTSVSSHTTQASASSDSKSQRRGSLDDKVVPAKQPRTASERAKLHRERSASMKIFPSQHALPNLPKIPSSVGGSSIDRLLGRQDATSATHTNVMSLPGRPALDENETDEHKMAKSTEMHVVSRATPPPPSPTRQTAIPGSPTAKFEETASLVPVIVTPEPMIIVTSEPLNHAAPEPLIHVVFTPDPPEREQDLMYMKKGWLIKMGTSEKDWKKHWFVLTGNSLRYYKDAKSEETNQLDGRIDLSSCYEISEVLIQRNYGFKIKTRNGEYILSAMTSGIRSNWMKAIRLCMDLQASNKAGPDGEGGAATPPRTTDDMEVDTAATVSSLLSTAIDTAQSPVKKEYTRNVRRHYSDVNPGNISKLLSIKGLDKPRGLSPSVSSQSSESSALSSKEPSIERETQPIQKQAPTHIDLGIISKPRMFSSGQDHVWSGDGIPFRRFVEGSDSEVAPVSMPEVTGKVTVGDKQKDEEDKKRRAKSPSAKIKDRSRAKSPKLHSPPPGQEKDDTFTFRTAGERTEADRASISSDDMDVTDGGGDIETMHLDGEENMASTMSSAGEGMLVDVLENEVESLKERLEHTEKELVKSHDSNSDLKSKLQSVVREKESTSQPQASIDTNTAPLSQPPDNPQMNTMKRQLKEARDTVQRHKNEIDGLKSKLDISVSKLTGTEKALSEALKDVKQEKDKFLKVTTEYNRKVRTLEGQLKDVTTKMDKYHDNSLNKDKENRRLDNDLKTHQQRLRDHEREILKLRAVEHEYRQMKEKFDETDRVMSRYRIELTEKDKQLKKIEIEYDEQYEKIMDDFTKERDDTEQHIEDLKRQLIEAKHKMSNNESLSSSMATILSDKDEIIAQLEEKVIESETKMVEISEEMNENEELSGKIEILEAEKDNAIAKMKEIEKLKSHYQNQVTRMEKENISIRKHMDDLIRENTDLSERLDDEKTDTSSLAKDNDELKSNVKDLEDEVHSLHKKSNDLVSSHDRLSYSSDGTTSQEMLHTFILATSEMNDISDYVLSMRKKVEGVLTTSIGDQKSSLTSVAEMLEDLGRKCENISDVLKEGSNASVDSEIELKKSKDLESNNVEMEALKANNQQSETELGKLKKEILTTQAEYEKLQSEYATLKEKVKTMDDNCKKSIECLSQRVEDLAVKHNIVSEKNSFDGNKVSSRDSVETISSVIEGQLTELEDHIDMVEKVLQTQDLSMSSIDSEADVDTAIEESESESEDSEDYSDSDVDEDELFEDTQDEITLADGPQNLLRKLRQMKKQLEVTNSRIKGLTSGITADSVTSTVEADTGVELELRNTLIRCGEKIDSLANRLSDGLKSARTEVPRFSDQTWAFQKCVNQVKSKLNAVNVMVHEHDEINAKDLKQIQERLRYLVEYVNQVDKLGDTDWDIAGKIAKQEMKFQHLLAHKENAIRQSSFKYEDKLQLYADKLSFEAMILGQMAILIQRQQIGGIYKDSLLREIHEANLQILELERRIDNTQRDMNPLVQEKDLVSSYASMLAEKIVLEGQLASCAMVQDVESSEHTETLSALNVSDSPAVLAMEIFLRSQVDSSVNEQLKKFAESLDTVSNHIVTRALLQGEITHALQVVKQKFKKVDQEEDLSSLVKRERQFAFDQLASRHKTILDLLNETEPLAMTTLIQLIEFTQGPSSPTLDSVCDNIADILHKKIEEYENDLKTADAQTKCKIEYIISHLHSELEDAISIFREEHQCYVQTASPDIDTNVLKFSADSVSSDLAQMFIQKAVIVGTFTYVSELHKSSPDVPVNQMMDPLETSAEGLSDLAKSLGQILLTEAANKKSLAGDIRQGSADEEAKGGVASGIMDMIGLIPDLEAYPQSFTAYAATLVREAMFQSQLTYTTYKLQLEYHRKLRDIKLKMEAGEKVVLPSEISQEAESDIQASLTIFEDILETKYQDECAVLSLLETEISKLKSTASEKSCSQCKTYESNVKQLENSFQHEVSVAQERQNVHIDVLRQEVNNVILRVDKFLEDYEKEKDMLVNDYEDRIATLQDEFDIMRIHHEEELEQVKQDIMTAVSAIKATEEEADTNSSDQLRNHNHQLIKMSSMCKDLLVEIRGNVTSVDRQTQLTLKIDEYMTYMQQIESDPAFILDLPSLPPLHDIVTSTPIIQTEGPPLDRSLSAEKSDDSVDRLLEKSHHEQEMQQLKKEKEEALADEVKTTKAALDAMRKAYEEELEQEKDKYRGALKTMFTDNYVEDIRRRHDIEAERLREELKQVSMHYESKCEDYKLLEDRLQRTKAEFQTHINQLSKSNEKLNELVNTEIENLKQFITTRTKGSITGNATLEEELYDAQIMVRVKDAELQKLRSQVKNIENNLERTTEEQRYTMTQYLQCLKKNQELQAKFKQEMTQQRERKDSSQEEQIYKNARALRRNPSFHQRARSPSPDTSPRKEGEHHSRDSHRRSNRHLTSKDLKRSKSSPSLPFVFEAKGSGSSPVSNSQNGQLGSTTLGRRDSAKLARSQRK